MFHDNSILRMGVIQPGGIWLIPAFQLKMFTHYVQTQDALLRDDLTSLETSHEASNARQADIRADLDSLSAVMDDTRNAYATRAEV